MRRLFVVTALLASSVSAGHAMPRGGGWQGGQFSFFGFHRAFFSNYTRQTAVSSPVIRNTTLIFVLNNSGSVTIVSAPTITQTSNAINFNNTGIGGYGGNF